MNASAIPSVPPPVPHRSLSWIPWRIFLVTLTLAALLILTECVWLHQRQQVRKIAWANEVVQQKIAEARVRMSQQRWDEAIRQLEDALDVEAAANRAEVSPVLEEARRGQAEAMLEAAKVALAHGQTDDALRLLRAYLASPQAEHLDRARMLRDDLERALADEEAVNLLERLSDEALTIFAEKGELTGDDGLHTAAARAVFQETLRRNLAKELRKREARREVARLTEQRRAAERAQRIARLRETPAYHSLAAFLARSREQIRAQQTVAQRQNAELDELFQQLGINDAEEQQQFRADLLGGDPPASIREQIERKRAEIKRAYRDSPAFQAADQELFDQLVDREVDAFLKTLPSS